MEVGPDPADVGRARRWARTRLARTGIDRDEQVAETLILIVSELVTNAVVHTGCPAVLKMLFGLRAPGPAASGTVRVEVTDRSARPPAPRHAEGDDTGGRGLELVGGLADRWGWLPEGEGKRIWCEVDRFEKCGPPAAQGASAAQGAFAAGRTDDSGDTGDTDQGPAPLGGSAPGEERSGGPAGGGGRDPGPAGPRATSGAPGPGALGRTA
jgi:Histidine kinase-like ATPase domain